MQVKQQKKQYHSIRGMRIHNTLELITRLNNRAGSLHKIDSNSRDYKYNVLSSIHVHYMIHTTLHYNVLIGANQTIHGTHSTTLRVHMHTRTQHK